MKYGQWAFTLLLCELTVLCLRVGAAQTTGSDLKRLLPTAAQTKDWTPKSAPKFLTGFQLYDYMDGAGEIPLACGCKTLAVAEYAGKTGGTVTIELYDMGSSANAFGLYSMKRLPGGKLVGMQRRPSPIQAQMGFRDLLCHKGRYTLLLFGDDPAKVKDTDLMALGTAVLSGIHEAGTLPDLLRFLPREGYVAQTGKYFHGKGALDTVKFVRQDLFRTKESPEVVVATYAKPPGKLMVIRYSSAPEAELVARAAQQSSETKGMIFLHQGRMLGAAWSSGGKPADGALVERLKRALQKPGPLLEGASAVR